MISSMSGSFVPPTWVSEGCSQNRVQAIGSIPQASRVSVTEGTSDTTSMASVRCWLDPMPDR